MYQPPTLDSDMAAPRGPRVIIGALAAIGSRLLGRLLALAFIALLARRQSQLVFAEYNYLLILAAAVSVITDSGVATVAAREVARAEVAPAAAYRATIVVQVVTGVSAGLLVGALGVLAPGPGRNLLALLFLTAFIAVTSIFNLQAELLRASGRPLVEGGLQLLAGLLQLGLGAAVLLGGGGLAAVLGTLALKQVAIAALAQAWLPAPWSAPADRRLRRRLLRRGLWLGGASTLGAVMWRAGALVLGNVGSVASVADFAVSSRVLELTSLVAYTLGIGMLPAVSRRASASPHSMRRFAVRITVGLTLAAVLVTVPAILLTGPVTVAIFGARYQAAVLPAQILVGVTPLVVLHYTAWMLLVAERHERWVTAAAATGACTALGGIALIVYRPEATVTAVATVTAITAATTVFYIGVGRITGRVESD